MIVLHSTHFLHYPTTYIILQPTLSYNLHYPTTYIILQSTWSYNLHYPTTYIILQVNLRAAPYDFRYGANSPTGQLYLKNLQTLIEDTYETNNGRRINILAHRLVGVDNVYSIFIQLHLLDVCIWFRVRFEVFPLTSLLYILNSL